VSSIAIFGRYLTLSEASKTTEELFGTYKFNSGILVVVKNLGTGVVVQDYASPSAD